MTWAPETMAQARWAVWASDDWDAGVGHCLARLRPLPHEGTLLDLGAGVGRLAIPVAVSRPLAKVLALDSSPQMIGHLESQAELPDNLVAVRATISTLDVEGLAGAWSVLCFQHLSLRRQRLTLSALAARLAPGAVVVVQYVTDCDWGPLSNPVEPPLMERWWARAGLVVDSHDTDSVYPTWRWITGRRQ